MLRERYDRSMAQEWTEGRRFKSFYGDSWYSGTVAGRTVADPQMPDSPWQSVVVRWDRTEDNEDDVEEEVLSPWDLDALDGADETDEAAAAAAATQGLDAAEQRRIADGIAQVSVLWKGESYAGKLTELLIFLSFFFPPAGKVGVGTALCAAGGQGLPRVALVLPRCECEELVWASGLLAYCFLAAHADPVPHFTEHYFGSRSKRLLSPKGLAAVGHHHVDGQLQELQRVRPGRVK